MVFVCMFACVHAACIHALQAALEMEHLPNVETCFDCPNVSNVGWPFWNNIDGIEKSVKAPSTSIQVHE